MPPEVTSRGARATLMLGAAMLVVARPAYATDVVPGGALDITVSGFARFLATYGEWDATQLDDELSTGLDFENDTEVHFLIRGKSEHGLDYGARVELEADTSSTNNGDETWVFLRGGFGEVRLGDEDGIADDDGMAVSAAEIAAGTGGLDGTQVDTYVTRAFESLGTSDATKIIYRSPSFGGFQVGASYTPNLSTIDGGSGNGDALAAKDVDAGDVVEGGVNWTKDGGDVDVKLGLTGLYGDIKNEDAYGGDEFWSAQIGAVLGFDDISIGGSYLTEKAGDFDQQAITAGAAYEDGPLTLSVNYALTLDADQVSGADFTFDHPSNLVFSGTYALMPGVTLDGDVAWIDNDLDGGAVEVDDDRGIVGVVQLGVAF